MQKVNKSRQWRGSEVTLFFFFCERMLIDQRDRQKWLMAKNDKHAHAEECRQTQSTNIKEVCHLCTSSAQSSSA